MARTETQANPEVSPEVSPEETPESLASSILDALEAGPKAGQGAGGNGGTRFAGVESRKFASAKALGSITVLGYGTFGQRKSYLGAQIRQGVVFAQDSNPRIALFAGYGEFSDYVGYVAANDGVLSIGVNGQIKGDGNLAPAPALVKVIDVCESRRGSRYVGEQAKVWADADTQARHGKAGTPKAG